MCQLQTSLKKGMEKNEQNDGINIRRYQLHFYCEDNEKNKSAIKYINSIFYSERKKNFLFFSCHL